MTKDEKKQILESYERLDLHEILERSGQTIYFHRDAFVDIVKVLEQFEVRDYLVRLSDFQNSEVFVVHLKTDPKTFFEIQETYFRRK